VVLPSDIGSWLDFAVSRIPVPVLFGAPYFPSILRLLDEGRAAASFLARSLSRTFSPPLFSATGFE